MRTIDEAARVRSRRGYIYWYCLLLPLAWIAAWRAHDCLDSGRRWTIAADTSYWIAMKFLVWLIPVFAVIRAVEHQSLAGFLELRNSRVAAAWSVPVGMVLLAADYRFVASPAGKYLGMPVLGAAFLNGVLVSPIVEEIAFRGFCLERLRLNGMPFWTSNLLTSVVFVGCISPGGSSNRKSRRSPDLSGRLPRCSS
jgi:membrane protease YdiL (CAAX protease family)